MLIDKYKIYPAIVALLLFSAYLPTPSAAALSEKQTYRILNSLLTDNYEVSFEAEELLIAFSEGGAPKISRYKIGRLMPSKRRRDTYRLDGTVEEIMVQDDFLQIVSYPDRKVVVRSRRNPNAKTEAISRELVSLVQKNYHIKSAGKEPLSGRDAFVVEISPKEKGTRPSFKAWIDHETGLPLKTETYTIEGALSFLSALSDVVINPSFPNDYFVIMVPHGTKAYEQTSADLDDEGGTGKNKKLRVPPALEGGYLLKKSGLDEKGNLQSIYHDGLNSISVFSEDWNDDLSRHMEKEALSSKNKLNKVKKGRFEGFFCSRDRDNILSFISGSHRYILVGEVSKKGLIDIAIDLKSEIEKNEN
ncbi:MAG: sigma-E factor regulatory protein RseB domain-containing protein [bacterium]|nr:sigma-E factor regulatory protein RseB domain-containing protein [bacterium]